MVAPRSRGQGRTSTRRRNSPRTRSEPALRVALVGCGSMGRVHVHQLLELPEVRVDALCDPVRKNLRAYQKELFTPRGLEPKAYTDYERMLKDLKLDAVVLVTPHALHHPQTCAALDAGLHVLVEKPMVTNVEHARDLERRAKKADRRLGIAFQAPVSPEFTYIRNLVRRGDLGRLEVVDAFVAQNWQAITEGTWRQDAKRSGGGMLFDTGAHMLNGMLWLVDSPVRRVFAALDRCGAKVEINATVTMAFENGCLGSVACLGNARGPIDSGITLSGTKGKVRTGIWGGALEHHDADGRRVAYPFVPYAAMSPHRNFVDAILGRDTLRCDARYGVRLSELMEAIYRSAETGLPVAVGQA